MSYNTKNYTEQGGEVTHIGGKLIIEEGGSVEGLPDPVIPDATTQTKGLVKQASNQTASTATTVELLVTDFNALLAKLKTAGILEADIPTPVEEQEPEPEQENIELEQPEETDEN